MNPTGSGFEQLLDDADFTFGQLEAAADDAAAGMGLVIETTTGPTNVDVVAIDEIAGEAAVLGFVWRTLNTAAVREKAAGDGPALSDTKKEQLDAAAETEICLLKTIVPWVDVIEVRVGGAVMDLFGGDST